MGVECLELEIKWVLEGDLSALTLFPSDFEKGRRRGGRPPTAMNAAEDQDAFLFWMCHECLRHSCEVKICAE